MGKGKETMQAQLDLHAVEKQWQAHWEKQSVYKFFSNTNKPVFSIDTPPPTVSGRMHMGHAFGYSQQDFIARFKRMRGFEVFHPFGFDDNGLATERFVQDKIKRRAREFSRGQFIEICLKETKEAESELKEDFSKLGMSVDWGLLYRTIEDYCRKQAQRSFIDIYGQGRLYQREAPAMWCPTCETAIAQAELEDKEKESKFVYIRFDVVGGGSITIATTRPELMPACVAVHVHPEDGRYKGIIGKEVEIPFFGRRVKIYANDAVDMEFGTGAVYHCTFGDLDDVEWVMALNLPIIEIMGKDGIFNEKAGKYGGMKVEEARKAVIEDLQKEGRIEKVEPITHVVNVHERCKTPIEILTAKQWFVKYLDLKDDFIAKGRAIKWVPEHFRARYENWIAGLKWDWNISRQRYFGVPFPLWYCAKCGKVMLAEESQLPVDPLKDKPKKKCSCGSSEFVGEKDVLDTWFTSSLTPQINCKWIEDEKFYRKIYPMSLRPQGHDIITLWAFNTIVKGLFHSGQVPWKDVMINGWALDPKGKKMSKSLGNVIPPQEMIEKYSADVLRYWAGSATLGEDIPFQEKEMVAGRKFLVKIFNASRFVASLTEDFDLNRAKEKSLQFAPADKWALSRVNSLKKEATAAFERYEFSKALNPVRDFFWLEFADFYIEEAKHRLYGKKDKAREAAQYTLLYVLLDCLKMLAPFLPHLTEEIMQSMFKKYLKGKSVHLEKWPEAEEKKIDEYYEELGKVMNGIIAALRKYKSGSGLPLNKELKKAAVYLEDKEMLKKVKEAANDISRTMNISAFEARAGEAPEGALEAGKGIKLAIEI